MVQSTKTTSTNMEFKVTLCLSSHDIQHFQQIRDAMGEARAAKIFRDTFAAWLSLREVVDIIRSI